MQFPLAGTEPDAHAGIDVRDVVIVLAAVLHHHPRRFRREAEQRLDGAGGALARAKLEHLPQENERGDHRGGLEVDGTADEHGVNTI